MTSREGKDTVQQLDKRKEASKKVNVQFPDETFTDFNVLDNDGKLKYTGKIDLQNINDECSCDSFFYGMKFERIAENSEKVESRYMAENGTAFQCKHVICAKEKRMEGHS